MSITFNVDPVERATRKLPQWAPRKYLRAMTGQMPVLATGGHHGKVLKPGAHPFANAVFNAFAGHRPLVLSPDAVWMTIAQGFAQHVRKDPEALRHKLVAHEGTRTLQADIFDLRSDQQWAQTLADFAHQVRAENPSLGGWLKNDFSTTTPAQRIAGDVVLLDAVQHWYDFRASYICGIPEVTLRGTVEDWRKIEERVAGLQRYGLGWWTDLLGPVCRELRRSAEGHVDLAFWESIFMPRELYGGDKVTGWMLRFFPYLIAPDYDTDAPKPRYRDFRLPAKIERNPGLESWSYEKPRRSPSEARYPTPSDAHRPWLCAGLELSKLPPGFSTVPVCVDDHSGKLIRQVQVLSGFIGVSQSKNLALEAEVGWAVIDSVESPVHATF